MSPAFDRKDDEQRRVQIEKALVDIRSVLERLGLWQGSKANNRGRTIRCPWHKEATPSCGVSLGQNRTIRAKCFSCQAGGDVFDLIAAVHGYDVRRDFPEVLGIAADLAGVTLPDRAPAAPPLPPPRTDLPPAPEDRAPATLDEELALGIALTLFAAAFPITSDQRLADGLAGRFLLEDAIAAGWCVLPRVGVEAILAEPAYAALAPTLLRTDDRGRPSLLFRDHRLVIPWRLADGRIWSFQRRFAPHTGSEDPKVFGGKVGKYVWPLASAYKPRQLCPYGADHYTALDTGTEEVWLAEGAPDVHAILRLNELGALSKKQEARKLTALGLPGVATLDAYLPALARFVRGKDVYVAADDDKAGNKARVAWTEALAPAKPRKIVPVTPPGGDWNELLQSLR